MHRGHTGAPGPGTDPMMGWVPLFQQIGRQGQEDGQAVSQKMDSPLSHWYQATCPTQGR